MQFIMYKLESTLTIIIGLEAQFSKIFALESAVTKLTRKKMI